MMTKQPLHRLPQILLTTALVFAAGSSQAITIDFDYTYDSNGFFADASRKTILESAGNFFETRLTDSLSAITSSGINQFDAIFSQPDNGSITTLNGYSVAADTLVIFVGGRDLGGSTLGQGGPGGYSATGTLAFTNTVASRGEPGVFTFTDFAPWGGSITFDTDSSWYFDSDLSTTESFSGSDFYSVALHEIGHVLGLGIADSWDNLISDGSFTGSNATSVYGSDVPLTSTESHWAEGTSSFVDGIAQEAAMDPTITIGTRKVFTDLDMAALDDIGWEVTPVPVPAAVYLFGSGLLGLLGLARRRRA